MTGNYCDASNTPCMAANRDPDEFWAEGQRTPFCHACEHEGCETYEEDAAETGCPFFTGLHTVRQRNACHFCRGTVDIFDGSGWPSGLPWVRPPAWFERTDDGRTLLDSCGDCDEETAKFCIAGDIIPAENITRHAGVADARLNWHGR